MRFPAGTLGLVAASVVVSSSEGLREFALYRRPDQDEAWRLLSAQLAHPTLGIAVADLGMLLLGGVCLERRSGRRWALSLAVSALVTARLVMRAGPELSSFQGASGLATGVLTTLLLDLAIATQGVARGVWLGLAALPLLKALFESRGWLEGFENLPIELSVYAPAHLGPALAAWLLAGLGLVVSSASKRGESRRRSR